MCWFNIPWWPRGKQHFLAQLFEDFVSSNEDWFQSSVYINVHRSSTSRRRGTYRMMMFKDMKERFGTLAPGILEEKRSQEQSKPPSDTTTYWMHHPDTKAEDSSRV